VGAGDGGEEEGAGMLGDTLAEEVEGEVHGGLR
jgi:hypothetical protein